MQVYLLILIWVIFSSQSIAQSIEIGSNNGQYIQVFDSKLYYEEYGQGSPLILLHGGLGSIENFKEVIPEIFKKSFAREFPEKYQLIQKMKTLRDNVIHTKNHSKGFSASYRYIFREYLDFDYEEAYKITKDYINYTNPIGLRIVIVENSIRNANNVHSQLLGLCVLGKSRGLSYWFVFFC